MNFLTALAAGVLVGLACPPLGLFPLAWVGFAVFAVPLLRASEQPLRIWDTALYFACLTLPMNLIYFYWFFRAFRNSTDLPWIICIPAMTALFMLLSLITAAFGGLYGFLRRRIPASFIAQSLFLLAFLIFWDTYEWRIFPYTPIQFSLNKPVLFAAVYYLKPLGLRVLLFGLSSALAGFYVKHYATHRRVFLAEALGVILLAGAIHVEAGRLTIDHLQKHFPDRQPVALIQDNFKGLLAHEGIHRPGPEASPQEVQAYRGLNIRRLQHLAGLVDQAAIGLRPLQTPGDAARSTGVPEGWVFWPETGLSPFEPVQMGLPLMNQFKGTADIQVVGYNARILKPGETHGPLYNSVAMIHARTGFVNVYYKQILFPIGEYIPGEHYIPLLRRWFPHWGHYSSNAAPQVLAHPDPQGPVFIPFICYEAIFGGHVRAMIQLAHRQYPGRPLILVNPTSDFQFGLSSENIQHSMLTRWQAALNGLPLVRPNGFGYTEIIAPWGEALQRTERDVPAVLTGLLPVEHTTWKTPKTQILQAGGK